MKIVIIDDDISFLEMFNKKINSSMKKILDQVIIDQYTNINLFPFQYDIYFLDIDLIDDNGISIAGKIKENDKNALIIFVTSKNNLVFSALKVQPFYFIRKGNLDEEFETALTLLKEHFNQKSYFSFKYDFEYIKILTDDILYLEVDNHLTSLVTRAKVYHLYKPLKEIMSEIKSDDFIQISRKNSVNIKHIKQYKKNAILLDNNQTLKIGIAFKSAVAERMIK